MTSSATGARTGTLAAQSGPFLEWLGKWQSQLPSLDISSFMQEAGVSAENIAVISADLVEGFCYKGPLSSPRIAGIVPNTVSVMKRAYELGVRDFALVQEYHTHDAPEFSQFGPHCIRGTEEAETVAPLRDLPFSDLFAVILKNSLHPALHTDLAKWIEARPQVTTFITVGDCTDLCLYQLVMYLKLNANAANRNLNVIVPANCVQTYDLSLEAARSIGAMPHDGDLLHAVFLYHMALNGARVVAEVS